MSSKEMWGLSGFCALLTVVSGVFVARSGSAAPAPLPVIQDPDPELADKPNPKLIVPPVPERAATV